MDHPSIGANLDVVPAPQVGNGPRNGGRPTWEPPGAGLRVPSRDDGVPPGAYEEREPVVDRDEIDGADLARSENLDLVIGLGGQAKQMARRVPESRGEVAERKVLASSSHVEGDTERAVSAGDHRRRVVTDPLAQEGTELGRVARRRDVDVGIERAPREVDRPSDTIGSGAPRPLVEEDGGAPARQGSSDRSCSASPSF